MPIKHYSYEGEAPRRGRLGIKMPVLFVTDINKLRAGHPQISSAGANSDVMVYDLNMRPKYKQAPGYVTTDKKGHIITLGQEILERYR